MDEEATKEQGTKNQEESTSKSDTSAAPQAAKAVVTKVATKAALSNPYMLIAIGAIALALLIFAMFVTVLIVLDVINNDSNGNGSGGSTASGTRECGFTISKTSLSKQEYKEKLEDFAASNPNFKPFADNANDIYDYAISKNVNPELVVVRAYVEGHGRTTGTNNYWGLGCTNESQGAGCYSWESFEEGYTYFINVVSKYDSLAEMMGKYAYIGRFWYTLDTSNPPGDGGCYYAEHIYPDNMPDRVKKACAADAPSCVMNGDPSECTPTTDEDQNAYATWQVKTNMGKARETIFGLAFDEGPCTGGTTNFASLSGYTLKHEGLSKLNKTFNDTEIAEFNDYINKEVDKAGYGTGAGVAAAGQALTYALEQKGYYLGYYWGGDRGSVGFGKQWGANKGIAITRGGNATGPEFGMDCSGFVSWAIRNACNSGFGAPTAATFLSRFGTTISSSSLSEAKPGDILVNSGHIILVIKNNGDGSIIAAEESYSSAGLVFNKYNSLGSYKLKDMSDYYNRNCKASR